MAEAKMRTENPRGKSVENNNVSSPIEDLISEHNLARVTKYQLMPVERVGITWVKQTPLEMVAKGVQEMDFVLPSLPPTELIFFKAAARTNAALSFFGNELKPKQKEELVGLKQNFLGALVFKTLNRLPTKSKLAIEGVVLVVAGVACGTTGPVITPDISPTQPVATEVAQTATEQPSVTEAPTSTPRASEVVPDFVKNLPPEVSVVPDANGNFLLSTKIEGMDAAILAQVDENGISFILPNQTIVDILPEEIANRIKVNSYGAFQVYDKTGNKIDYAYDSRGKEWIETAEWIQSDHSDVNKLLTLDSWEDFSKMTYYEHLLLPDFPPNTYVWDRDKIIFDYLDYSKNDDVNQDYTYWSPLGVIKDINNTPPPIRLVNFSVLKKGDDRVIDTYIFTEQVYNPKDDSFSVLHFSFGLEIPPDQYGDIIRFDNGWYYLPDFDKHVDPPYMKEFKASPMYNWLLDKGYIFPDLSTPKIKDLTNVWLTDGKVPNELEVIVFYYNPATFLK